MMTNPHIPYPHTPSFVNVSTSINGSDIVLQTPDGNISVMELYHRIKYLEEQLLIINETPKVLEHQTLKDMYGEYQTLRTLVVNDTNPET